jgi:hypothetical protein
MKKVGIVRCVIVGAVMSAYAAGTAAQAVQEQEINYPVAQPVAIDANGKIVINGVIGVMFGAAVPDQDLFSFYANEGDLLDIDIDNGVKFGAGRSVRTVLNVLGPAPDYIVQRQAAKMTELTVLDEGSVSPFDPYIEKFRAPKSGIYVVGVTAFDQTLVDGGGFSGFGTQNGDYTLIISGATAMPSAPVAQQINIEVKPGSREFTPVNPKAKGHFPVALLSSKDFDALKVDRSSLSFGASGDERSVTKCAAQGRDVNGDGMPDLVCHFDNEMAKFGPEDLEAVLKGAIDGKLFEGRGALKVLPAKKQK